MRVLYLYKRNEVSCTSAQVSKIMKETLNQSIYIEIGLNCIVHTYLNHFALCHLSVYEFVNSMAPTSKKAVEDSYIILH